MERQNDLEERERKQGTRRGGHLPSPSFAGTGGLEKAPTTPTLFGARKVLKNVRVSLCTLCCTPDTNAE